MPSSKVCSKTPSPKNNNTVSNGLKNLCSLNKKRSKVVEAHWNMFSIRKTTLQCVLFEMTSYLNWFYFISLHYSSIHSFDIPYLQSLWCNHSMRAKVVFFFCFSASLICFIKVTFATSTSFLQLHFPMFEIQISNQKWIFYLSCKIKIVSFGWNHIFKLSYPYINAQ